MDDFKAIYRILSTLKKAMDCEEFDASLISAERVGISEQRWKRCMEMLHDEGLVKNIVIEEDMAGFEVEADNARITLAGLQYLHENSMMQKAYKAIKGIADIMP